MRMAITVLSFAAAVGIASCQSARAVAVDAAAMKEAASAVSRVQQARFYGHATSAHYVVKCYAKSSSAHMCAAASIVGDGKLE
jgi:type II secretory pathway pseudopilin PulG